MLGLSERGYRAIFVYNPDTKLITIIKAETANYVSTSQIPDDQVEDFFKTKNFVTPEDDYSGPVTPLDQVPNINNIINRTNIDTKNG